MTDRQAMALSPATRAAIILLAVLALFTALWVARPIAAPLLLAFVVAVVLGPVQDVLCRIGIPSGLAASGLLLAMLVGGGVLLLSVEPLVWRIWDEVPRIRWELRSLLWELRGALRGIESLNEELLGPAASGGPAAGAEGGVSLPTAFDAALLAPTIIGQVLVFLGTLYFALTGRQVLYASLTSRHGGAPLRMRIDAAERQVSRYFGTISLINLGLGAAVAVGLGAIGLPLAIVWGAAAALLNFALYIGPAFLAVALTLAGLINFEGAMIFAPPAVYLALNATEAQFVTPSLVGRHMRMNPLLVFVSIVFWLWLWGPVGGIVAIPVLLFVIALNETGVVARDDGAGATA